MSFAGADPPRGRLSEPIALSDPDATRALGAALARRLRAGDILLLEGELGAGKTSLVQGLAAELGVEDRVTSPTFAFCHRYVDRRGVEIHHYDLYRAENLAQLVRIGFEESLEQDAFVLVEWPRRALPLLHGPALLVRLCHDGDARSARLGWLDPDELDLAMEPVACGPAGDPA